MGPVEHIDALQREGMLLAEVADEVGLHAPVPTCPTWTMRDLLWHTGTVHRWAKAIVEQRRVERPPRADLAGIVGPIPDDALLVEWYRESLGQLVRTLLRTDPDLECWCFLPAPSALEFWSRRQAHETAIHRVDAESARGDEISPVGNGFAADGIDELVIGFHGNPTSRVRSATNRTLRLRAIDDAGGGDGGTDWYLHFSPAPLTTTRVPSGPVDCTLSGPAELLYLALWNRCRIDDLTVDGDATLIKLWQESSAIEWSYG